LEISDDAIQVKYKTEDFNESDANGLEIDYSNGQAAASGIKGFLTGADWATFNAKESETHAEEHAAGAADPVFPAEPGFHGIFTWDDTAGVTEWGTSADLSYDGSNWTIVDDSHNHVYSNIDAFTEANLYTLLSDVSQFYEPGDDAQLKSVQFTDEDVSPTLAGQLKYDNTITGLVDGGLVWYDDDEVQLIVSVAMADFGSGPTDDYVLGYDAINDKHYYMEASAVGGNTKFNLIEDADADGSIALGGFEQEITTTIDEAGGVALTIKHSDSDGLTNDSYLIELIHANDADTHAHFMRGLDNTSNELWSIAYDGTATFKAVNTTGAAIPGYIFKDTDAPGTDKEIAKIYANYLSGADGAEDGGLYLQVMIAGTERTFLEFNADTEALTMGNSVTGEDLVWDFDTGVANEVAVSQNSGTDVIDFGTINIESDQFESDVATGTPPLIVASTTVVTNLNADTVDGESASEIVTAARVGAISANLDDTDASIEWEDAADLDSTGAVDEAELAALKGLTFADASIIQLTGPSAAAVLTSGGNNYFLGSNSDNTALEFKTPANVLSQIGAQATVTEGSLPDGVIVSADIKNGEVAYSDLAASSKFQSLAVADLGDATTPHVLTVEETTNKVISNYASSGADRIFTMPAAHAAGNVIFTIGDEFQVDIEPNTDDLFYLNGTAMAANEHIQNTADTLGQRIVGYCVNINGTLRWMFYSSDTDFVEETP